MHARSFSSGENANDVSITQTTNPPLGTLENEPVVSISLLCPTRQMWAENRRSSASGENESDSFLCVFEETCAVLHIFCVCDIIFVGREASSFKVRWANFPKGQMTNGSTVESDKATAA